MKESEDKIIEKLIDKVMKQSTLETPSVDFTSIIMGKVDVIKANASTTYEPLISKRIWFAIFGVFLVFVVYVIWIGKLEGSGWFGSMDFNILSANKFSEIFNGIRLSNTTSVSILMFAVMLLVQIPLLKYYFSKRILG